MFMQPLLHWKSNNYYKFSECVCVFVACGIQHGRHVRRCHLWPAALYNIFPHYLTNGMIFKKEVIELKMCFISKTSA